MVFPESVRSGPRRVGLLAALTLLPLVSRPDIGRQMEMFGAGIVCMAGAVFFILWIFVLIWVYRDAEERGMSGGLWVLITFFLGIIGLIIYIVVRSDKPTYPQGAYYPPPYSQQGYYQQPQYPQPQHPPQQYPPQQPPPEPPKRYDPETGEYR